MTYTELQTMAHTLARKEGKDAEKELADNLRGLATDPRFYAVLALVLKHKADYVTWVAQPVMAKAHGSLEHCAGSICALKQLEDYFAGLFRARPQSGLRPEEEV